MSKKIFNKIKLLKEKELILLPSLEAILYIKNKIYPNLAIFGAQNCSTCINGAFTGDISAEMIKKIGCKYVLIGHSERRSLYKEDNNILSKKVLRASEVGLKIIFCVGENLDDYNCKKSLIKLKLQFKNIFFQSFNFKNLIIAYEPVWAIGSNKTPKMKEIDAVHAFIKDFFKKKYKINNIPVLYGGSVNSKNSKEIFSLKNVP